jgi:U3 small nucleolar RNA-associated protein 22
MKSHQIRIPFPEPRPGIEAKYTLAYAKPINVNVVGSYARKTAIEVDERLMVDLAVTMPSV